MRKNHDSSILERERNMKIKAVMLLIVFAMSLLLIGGTSPK